MTGQNDRQEESLIGQVRDQVGHCPLTGHYLQPCFFFFFFLNHIFLRIKLVFLHSYCCPLTASQGVAQW